MLNGELMIDSKIPFAKYFQRCCLLQGISLFILIIICGLLVVVWFVCKRLEVSDTSEVVEQWLLLLRHCMKRAVSQSSVVK
jgi:hypothetical protein